MLKIGVTGGIGSGKTLVCSIFQRMGIPVYSADIEAKKLLNNNSYVKKKLINTFGSSIYDTQGMLIRKKLATLIFNSSEALEKVNAIVHPAVKEHFNKWADEQKKCEFVIKEAAILFESGSYKEVDKVVMVTAPLALRIKRVMQRDGVGKKDVQSRIKAQWTDDEKMKRSDFVIYNNECSLLLPQIIETYNSIMTFNK